MSSPSAMEMCKKRCTQYNGLAIVFDSCTSYSLSHASLPVLQFLRWVACWSLTCVTMSSKAFSASCRTPHSLLVSWMCPPRSLITSCPLTSFACGTCTWSKWSRRASPRTWNLCSTHQVIPHTQCETCRTQAVPPMYSSVQHCTAACSLQQYCSMKLDASNGVI